MYAEPPARPVPYLGDALNPSIAEQIAGGQAGRLLGVTADLAQECVLDPVADFGLGDIHVPELDVLLSGRPTMNSGSSPHSASEGTS